MENNNNLHTNKQLRAIIIGATGAVGRELVDILLKSKFYSNITVLARRKIDRWTALSPEESLKLKFINVENLDILSKSKEELEKLFNNDTKYDTVFCCLGSRVKKGDEFIRVDYDYVIYSSELAEKLAIPHFSLVSSAGANSKSWFLYFRTKGKADEECLKKNIPYISILRPGLIKNRDNDSRCGEKVFAYVPFLDKITSVDLAKALAVDDVKYHLGSYSSGINPKRIFIHSEIEQLKNETL
jgi:oxidoreductase